MGFWIDSYGLRPASQQTNNPFATVPQDDHCTLEFNAANHFSITFWSGLCKLQSWACCSREQLFSEEDRGV